MPCWTMQNYDWLRTWFLISLACSTITRSMPCLRWAIQSYDWLRIDSYVPGLQHYYEEYAMLDYDALLEHPAIARLAEDYIAANAKVSGIFGCLLWDACLCC